MGVFGFYEPWSRDMSVFDPRVRDIVNKAAEAAADYEQLSQEIKAKLIEIEPEKPGGEATATIWLPVFLTGVVEIVAGQRWVYNWAEIRNPDGAYGGWQLTPDGFNSTEYGVARNMAEDLLSPPVHGSGWQPDHFPPDASVPFALQHAPLNRPIPLYLIPSPKIPKGDLRGVGKTKPAPGPTIQPWFDFQNMPDGEC